MVAIHGWRECRIHLQPRDEEAASPKRVDEANRIAAAVWLGLSDADRKAWHQFFCWGFDGADNAAVVARVSTTIRERLGGRARATG